MSLSFYVLNKTMLCISFIPLSVELEEGDGRRLVDVGCLRDKCTIQLIVHVDGGGWPTESEVEQRIRNPTKIPSLAGRITRVFGILWA